MAKEKQNSKRKQNPKSKETVVRKADRDEMTDEELTKVAGGSKRTSGLA
jgi:hypothetical protein